jgi:hypothetical protein
MRAPPAPSAPDLAGPAAVPVLFGEVAAVVAGAVVEGGTVEGGTMDAVADGEAEGVGVAVGAGLQALFAADTSLA